MEKHLAQAARESEEWLRHLGDSLPDCAVYRYTRGADGRPRFQYISAGIVCLSGVRAEEILRDPRVLLRQILPEYRAQYEEAEKRSAIELSDFKLELPLRHRDGEVRWMRFHSRPHLSQEGALVWDGVQSDITEQKCAEEASRASEEKLRFALDAAELGTWRWDAASDEVHWDTRCKALYGLPPDADVTWETWSNTIHAEDRERVETVVGRALDPSDPQDQTTCEFRVRHPDGTVHWLRSTGKVYFKPDPESPSGRRAIFKAGVTRDITQIRAAEAANRVSEERLRLALEAAHAGSWEWTLNDDRNIWSDSLWALFGLTPGECEPSFESWASSVHPDDRRQVTAAVRAATAAGHEFEIQWRVYLSDGKDEHWLLSRGRPVGGANGAPERYIGIVIDVTARKQAEAELERMRMILAEGQRIAHLGSFEYIAATQETVWSDEEKRIYGLDPAGPSPVYEEMLRHHIHPDDAAELDREFRKAFQDEAVFENENRIVRPDGNVRWIHNCAHPYFDPGGRLVKYIGATLDITERRKREEHVQLLLREVNHRSKNMLSLVQAIARQTLAANPQDFLDRFGKRVEALAASQDLLVKNEWRGANLDELVRSQLAHFEDLIGTRIVVQGPALFASATAAQAIGMALHELATNSGKYGALADGSGHVLIEWSLERAKRGAQSFVMAWREHSVHPIVAPSSRGFGSTVICEMAEMSLDAKVELDFSATGLTWRLLCPAGQVLGEDNPSRADRNEEQPGDHPATDTRPRILVVEDEALVDLELIALIMRQIEAHQHNRRIEINPGALSDVLLTVAALGYQEALRLEGRGFSLEEIGRAFGQLAQQRIRVVGEIASTLKPFKH